MRQWFLLFLALFSLCSTALAAEIDGTGTLTEILSERGYDMTGVDASPEMLSVARERCSENTLLLCQNMCAFELYGTVGAVTCCLDSLNYLLEDGDLQKCFATVHNYLDPDGLFLFDMNTPYKFRNVYADNAYVLEDELVYQAKDVVSEELQKDFYATFWNNNVNLHNRF